MDTIAVMAAAIPEPESDGALVRRIREEAIKLRQEMGWSVAEVSRRSDVPNSTLAAFLADSYAGNAVSVARKLQHWIDAEHEAMENRAAGLTDPGFVENSLTRQIFTALQFAQTNGSMVLITMGSGLGKSMTLKWYAAQRPNAYRVPITPLESGPAPMIRTIARSLSLSPMKRVIDDATQIADRVRREGGRQSLLMIDEAQNLSDEAINQLRFLMDEAGCGLALAGNEDLMRRYALSATREGYGQIEGRIGMRVHVRQIPQDDVEDMLNRLGITDKAVRKLGLHIAARAGGFHQLIQTMKLASIIAYGKGREMSVEEVRAAWGSRSREDRP